MNSCNKDWFLSESGDMSSELPDRENMIAALKKRFPVNNPDSWGNLTTSQLTRWYGEYIKDDKSDEMEV